MQNRTPAVVIHEKDTVATALKPLHKDTEISIEKQGRIEKIRLLTDIPAGHKFALTDMEKGADVVKYGEPIGQSTLKIIRGEHVHTHNVKSRTIKENR